MRLLSKPVIILEEMNFIFRESELKKITELHHRDCWIDDIAEELKRNEYEILLALVHQHIKRKIKKPLKIRRK